MSLYKNISSIAFHSETKSAQIFVTERHWLVQSKFLSSISECTRRLTQICQSYNTCFEKNLLQLYSEGGKFPSLLMSRSQVSKFDLASDTSIQFLCTICGILVRTFESIETQDKCVEIESGMFFRLTMSGEGFYLHIPKLNENSFNNEASPKNLCESILIFLEKSFNINHISNKLLITKLKKSSTLKQMKEELDYFQKVYEIGVKKVQKEIKNIEEMTNLLTEQKQQNKKVNHRRYRKRSEEVHEQHSNSHHYSIPLPKRHSTSDSHEKSSKNRQCLTKNSQSLHDSHKRTTKITLFSNRNKPTKGIHFNTNSSSRFQTMGSYSLPKEINKGIFSKSKFPSKNLKAKKLQAYSANTFQFSRTAESAFNYSSLSNGGSLQASKIFHSMSKNNNHKTEKNEKIISKHYDDFISSQKQEKQVKDDKTLKQIMANTLSVCKEKKNKRESLMSTHKQNSYHDQSSKSLKRRSKNQKQSFKFIDQGWIQKIIQKSEDKQSQAVGFKKSTRISQELKCHQAYKSQELDPAEKQKKQSNADLQEIQEIKLSNQDTIRPRRDQPKKKVQIQQVNYNHTKMNSRNSQLKSQNSQIKQPKQKQQQKQNQQKTADNQKEKTTRKKNAHVNEILQNNLLKSIKSQLQKINYIGECVTKMPNYIKNLSEGEDERYLWQLPAFILYKEFYIRRIQIEEKLKGEIHLQKITSPELTNLLKDIQEQNAETKQSLTKLLKVTLKKLKKYEVDPRTVEQTKNFLNLDLTIRWSKRVNQIIYNFITELEQMRKQKAQVLSILIEICDVYFICNGGDFDVEERKKICPSQYRKKENIEYLKKKMEMVSL